MIIAFANNQAMTAISGTPSVIYTDPVPLNDNDRATANFNVHYVWTTGTTSTIAYKAQVSNDGTNWIDVTLLADSTTAAELRQKANIAAYGGFIRFYYTLTIAGSAGTLGGVGFDLHVLLDKS